MTLIPQISSPKFRAASTSRCGFSKPTCSHLIILRREDLGIERTSHGVSVVRLCTQSEFWEESSPRSTVYLSGLCVEMTVRPQRKQKYTEGRREIIRYSTFVQSSVDHHEQSQQRGNNCHHRRSEEY